MIVILASVFWDLQVKSWIYLSTKSNFQPWNITASFLPSTTNIISPFVDFNLGGLWQIKCESGSHPTFLHVGERQQTPGWLQMRPWAPVWAGCRKLTRYFDILHHLCPHRAAWCHKASSGLSSTGHTDLCSTFSFTELQLNSASTVCSCQLGLTQTETF